MISTSHYDNILASWFKKRDNLNSVLVLGLIQQPSGVNIINCVISCSTETHCCSDVQKMHKLLAGLIISGQGKVKTCSYCRGIRRLAPIVMYRNLLIHQFSFLFVVRCLCYLSSRKIYIQPQPLIIYLAS